MKMSFCDGEKECCGFGELRRKINKIVWSRGRGESFKDNIDEMMLDFLNESWYFHFVTISHENQSV